MIGTRNEGRGTRKGIYPTPELIVFDDLAQEEKLTPEEQKRLVDEWYARCFHG